MFRPTEVLRWITVAAAMLLLPAAAFALDTEPVDVGSVEVTVGGEMAGFPEGTDTAVSLTVAAGVVKQVDIAVTVPYAIANPDAGDSVDGFGDVEVAVLWNPIGENAFAGLALEGTVKLPTADKGRGLGSGEFDFTLGMRAAKAFGPFELDLSAAYTLVGDPDGEDLDNVFAWGIDGNYDLLEGLSVSAGLAGENGAPAPLEIAAGISWDVNEMVTIDLGGGVGMSDASPDWTASAEMTLAF